MVKWQGRRQSENVEDRRGAAAAGGAGLLLFFLRFIIGRFGLRGLFIVGVAAVGLYMIGVNPLGLFGGGTQTTQSEPVNDETSQFVRAKLAETEDVWTRLFRAAGEDYPEPTLVMFTGSVSSGCGYASAAAGPFYCPMDRKLYLDACSAVSRPTMVTTHRAVHSQ
ncbi:MAG: neutral zinc metallopeptidase [Oricola sp.]|nr:neutral zinc metallopeptidase [Oricola sp.]